MNIKSGCCEDCGEYWTVSGGGLNDDGQCLVCERKFQFAPAERGLEESLAEDGVGLGAC